MEFSQILRRPSAAAGASGLEARAGEAPLETGISGKRELLRSARPEAAEPDLAPEDQPGMRRGAGDAAELFALLSPTVGVSGPLAPPEASPPSPASATQLADLVERWVRRVAMGGDQRRGAVRLDIGEGRHAGAELMVSAEAGHVSVELTLPQAPTDSRLSERLRARLEQRGLSADVTVR